MTRILLVEDEQSAIDAFCELLKSLPGRPIPVIARSRDTAVKCLTEDFYDLMVLDLKIPTTDNAETIEAEYGFAVFGVAKELAPGMPVYLLTGSSVESFVPDLLKNKQEVDIWANGKRSTVTVLKKIKLDELEEDIKPFVEGPFLLSDVELQRNGVQLNIQEERLVRIFAKRFQGTRCTIWNLKQGLSGSRVLRTKVFNQGGGLIHQAIAKIGSIDEIRNEKQRYEQYIHRLPPGVTPRLLTSFEFGGKSTAAIFYQLADGHDRSFFQFSIDQAALCAPAVDAVAIGLRTWVQAAQEGIHPVSAIRQSLITDAERAAVLNSFPIGWSADFESRNVQTKWGCAHNDFHGTNTLLTNAGMPAVIDYGDVGPGPICLDPLTLEFSIFFHPDGPQVGGAWPTDEAAKNWFDLEQYLVDCPCPEFVRACRKWTDEIAVGPRDIAAVSYAYFLRQLKYEGTNKQRALAFLEGSRRLWEST